MSSLDGDQWSQLVLASEVTSIINLQVSIINMCVIYCFIFCMVSPSIQLDKTVNNEDWLIVYTRNDDETAKTIPITRETKQLITTQDVQI